MILTTLMEVVSVGLVVPALSALSGEPDLGNYDWLHSLPTGGGRDQLVVVVFLLIIAGFILKNLVLILSSWYQNKFTLEVGDRLATDLFSNYLFAPYVFHTEQSSAETIRNVQRGDAVMHSGAKPLLSLIADSLLSLGLLSLLVAQQPFLVLLLVIALSAFGYFYLAIMRPLAYRWGRSRHENVSSLIRLIQEGVGGIREVKIFGSASFLSRKFGATRRHDSQVAQVSEVIALLPRSILESLAVIVLGVFVVVQVQRGTQVSDLVPTLGLFAVVGFRLLPLAVGVVNRLQTLQTSRAVIESVAAGLKMNPLRGEPSPSAASSLESLEFEAIQLLDVWFRYPNSESHVLAGASVLLKAGDFVGVIGESGSGKSTLVDLITGLSKPTRGEIKVNGESIDDVLDNWLKTIGYVPQNVFLSDDSLASNVAFGCNEDEVNVDLVLESLQLAGLAQLVDDLPNGVETKVGERGARLSGGQVQRVGIARALYRRPQVLLLDEATSALDHGTEREFLNVLTRLNSSLTIVFVTHRSSALDRCSRILQVDDGEIVELPINNTPSFKQA